MADEKSTNNPFLGAQKISEPTVDSSPSSPPKNTSFPSAQPVENPDSGVVSASSESIPSPEKKRWRRWGIRLAVVLVSVVLVAVGVYLWFRQSPSAVPVDTLSESEAESPVTEPTPALQPKTEPLTIVDEDISYASENFKAGEIVFGGEMQFLVDEDEVATLAVENIRGEAFTEKNKQEVKLVVTWTTNKLSQASVSYSKGIGQTERAIQEDDFSYNHSVIISGLDPASTYLYTIEALDRYGNRVKSEPHAVFTGARTVSLFDLIAGAIGEVFGWAVTK